MNERLPTQYVWEVFYISAESVDKIVRNVYNNSTKKGSGDMSITATELKNNLGKYLLLSATEDIYITKNGKVRFFRIY